MAQKKTEFPMWLEEGKLYELVVYLLNATADNKKGLHYVNLAPEKILSIRSSIFSEGIVYHMKETGTTELISPSNISQVLILPQKAGKI